MFMEDQKLLGAWKQVFQRTQDLRLILLKPEG
jgi:hypothetical protein